MTGQVIMLKQLIILCILIMLEIINVISSESYGSIDRHKDISFNASTLLHKDTITILLMLILFIYSLKLFKLIT